MKYEPTVRQRLVANVTRLYPFYSGSSTFANNKLIRAITGNSNNIVWSNVPGGKVLSPLNDYVGRSAFYVGDLDRKITWICNRLVRPGDTVMDIGANIGIITVLLSKLVGEKGKVHAFEPNLKLCRSLKITIDHNKISNVCLHQIALGSEKSLLSLRIPQYNAGAGSFIRNSTSNNCETIEVLVRPLSQIVFEENIKKIRLIKIDVEGFEAEVLKGADKMLSTIRPEVILFELNEQTVDKPSNNCVFKILENFEYYFFSIPKCLLNMSLSPFNPNTDQLVGHDFLAVQKQSYKNVYKLLR